MKKLNTTALMGLIVSALVGFGINAGAAEIKLGYVDMQKAIQETSAGKKAKKELEKEFNSKKDELQKKEADLKKMNEDLEKKKVALSDEVRAKKTQELQQEMLKYRELVGQSQLNIQRKEQELTKPILEKIQEIVEKVAKDGAYTMIFEKSDQNPNILWAKKELDLTDEVIKQFEKGAK